ncbi:hypothetical protein L249_0965 [Ophiocordyceps polyrhachis-furcata BCC 54312]|uniref:Uncharacterized protein n=1 Tax=Ophiocordyceps polyrhachis-furcata BCC 54312 TaxID=1330021 RepID=A0A367LCK8_9HYPO|nr:hypothetical protein L249_0965 [Ophiocordyceps polyrhachis-furcata BCC 54312]
MWTRRDNGKTVRQPHGSGVDMPSPWVHHDTEQTYMDGTDACFVLATTLSTTTTTFNSDWRPIGPHLRSFCHWLNTTILQAQENNIKRMTTAYIRRCNAGQMPGEMMSLSGVLSAFGVAETSVEKEMDPLVIHMALYLEAENNMEGQKAEARRARPSPPHLTAGRAGEKKPASTISSSPVFAFIIDEGFRLITAFFFLSSNIVFLYIHTLSSVSYLHAILHTYLPSRPLVSTALVSASNGLLENTRFIFGFEGFFLSYLGVLDVLSHCFLGLYYLFSLVSTLLFWGPHIQHDYHNSPMLALQRGGGGKAIYDERAEAKAGMLKRKEKNNKQGGFWIPVSWPRNLDPPFLG